MIKINFKKTIFGGGNFNTYYFSRFVSYCSSSSCYMKRTIPIKSKSKQTIQINAHKIKSKYDQN